MDNRNETYSSELELLPFDPIVLIQDVLRRWLVIVLVALLAWTGTYIYADVSYRPVYQTSTTFVVTSRSSTATVYSNLSSTTSLANVFTDILNSSLLRKEILAEIGADSFDGTIDAQVISETNLLTVTVTASDPSTAFQVARAVIDHHQVVDGLSLEVLQNPTVPMSPTNYANASGKAKQAAKMAAAAAAVGLLVLSGMRNTVRSGHEARKKLDCDYLGEIPHERKRKTLLSWFRFRKTGVLITNPATSFRYVETMRKLRRRVEQRMHGGKVLMVTSLLENEGKSTVAVNLALAMAQRHAKVLLIDCDLRKPACHVLLEQRKFPHGVRDVLLGQAKLEEAVLQEPKSRLHVLLERRRDLNSGDLLASGRMAALIERVREEYDYIILDLPPMGEVSDAEAVMELADASLLVVRQNTAPTAAVNKAVDALESGKAKLLGCVLNNVIDTGLFSGQGSAYGSYGHYGQYGHYGSGDSGK